MRIMLVLTALVLWSASEFARADNSPEDLLRQTAAVVTDTLQEERTALEQDPRRIYELMDRILFPHVDMPRLARLVLGRYWRQATPEQRSRFTEEFKRLLQRTYATAIQTYIDEITEQAPRVNISYQPTRVDPETGEALVRTVIETPRGRSYAVDYRMHRREEGWKIYDIIIEGISLLTNYRTSFAAEAQRVGVDGLIAELAERNRRSAGTEPAEVGGQLQPKGAE